MNRRRQTTDPDTHVRIGLFEGLLADPLHSRFADTTDDLVFLQDADGRYLMVNDAHAHHLGHARDETIGRTDAELAPSEPVAAACVRLFAEKGFAFSDARSTATGSTPTRGR